MLDHRVYRAAFVPAVVAMFVAAFSLAARPEARTTRLAPDAFDAARAFGTAEPPPRNSLRALAREFSDRRPGSPDDAALADRLADWFTSTGFADAGHVERMSVDGDTPAGKVGLENVVAVREGLSSRTVMVVAHRDARRGQRLAELSGTAAMMELARVLADRDLRKTVVLASVSGGSGGFDGARALADLDVGPVDAVLVLGNLAGAGTRRPWVVPWTDGGTPAPHGLRRTVEAALRREAGSDAGRDRASVQWARRALPLTLTEQGALGAEGLPAVLISTDSERGPVRSGRVGPRRFRAFGRGVLRALTATLEAGPTEGTGTIAGDPPPAFPGGRGIIVMKRLLPDWAVRLVVFTLLLPALLAAVDAFFRVRRRGLPMGRWLAWTASFALPFLLAWWLARALDLTGAVTALPAPAAQGVVPLDTTAGLVMGAVVLILLGGLFGLRPLLVRRIGARGDAAAGGAAAATGLWLAGLTVAVWVFNPYAAAVLLPAAHLWLLASAPESRLRRAPAWLAVAGGLLGPLVVALVYVWAWGLGPVEGLWTAFGIVSGGVLGVLAALAFSAFAAALCATVLIVRSRGRAASVAPPESVVTRGPGGYAGPGSLGGTESALRR